MTTPRRTCRESVLTAMLWLLVLAALLQPAVASAATFLPSFARDEAIDRSFRAYTVTVPGVTPARQNAFLEVRRHDGTVLQTLSLGTVRSNQPAFGRIALAVDETRHLLYILMRPVDPSTGALQSPRLLAFDPQINEVVRSVPLTLAQYTSQSEFIAAAVDPVDQKLYFSHAPSGSQPISGFIFSVSVADGSFGTVSSTVLASSYRIPEYTRLVIDPAERALYASALPSSGSGQPRLLRADLGTGAATVTADVVNGFEDAFALDAAAASVYVSRGTELKVLDAQTLAVTATLTLPGDVFTPTFDPVRRLLFVQLWSDDNHKGIGIIDVDRRQHLHTLPGEFLTPNSAGTGIWQTTGAFVDAHYVLYTNGERRLLTTDTFAPGDVTFSWTDGNHSITLTWSPPFVDGGRPISGYDIFLNGQKVATVDGATRSYDIRGLRNAVPVTVTVRAVSDVGTGPIVYSPWVRPGVTPRQIPVGTDPTGIAIDEPLRRIYVANRVSGDITVLDAETWETIATVPIGAEARRVGVDDVRHKVYVTTRRGGWSLVVLDGQTLTEDAVIPLPVTFPFPDGWTGLLEGIAVDSRRHRVFAGGTVIDGTTNTILATYSPGWEPDLTIDPASGKAFAASYNAITVVDPDDGFAMQQVPGTPQWPYPTRHPPIYLTVDFDPVTGLVHGSGILRRADEGGWYTAHNGIRRFHPDDYRPESDLFGYTRVNLPRALTSVRFGKNGFAYGVQDRLDYPVIHVNEPYAMVSVDPFKEGLSDLDLVYASYSEEHSRYYTLKLFYDQWIGQLDVDSSSNMVYILGSSMTEPGPGFVWAYPGRLRSQVISLLAPPYARIGTTIALTATGGWSGNPITFSVAPSSDPGVCTVDEAGRVSFAALGRCVIAANQRGDDSFLDAAQALATIQVVDKFPQTITFTAPAAGVVGETLPLTLAGGESGNPVVAALHPSTDPQICAVHGDSVLLLSPGACLLVATQDGNDDYFPADPVTQTIAVGKAPQQIGFAGPGTGVVGGSAVLVATPGPSTSPVVFAVDPGSAPGVCAVSGNVVTYAAVGQCTVVATQAGDSRYLDAEPVLALILVEPATPTITWASPAPITYGTPLGAAQLNASANVPGTFSYTPAAGTVLSAGTAQTLAVTFTPDDAANYTTATATATIDVLQATPVITWETPAAIVYGTALGAAQLNASANVPGTFSYTPAAGTVLPAGLQTLSVEFQPDDANYRSTAASVTLDVAKAPQTITFSAPSSATAGDVLTLAATGGNSTSAVAFAVDALSGAGVCVVNGAQLTLLQAGTCVVTASQDGDANYLPAPPVTRTIAVLRHPTAFSYSGPTTAVFGMTTLAARLTDQTTGAAVAHRPVTITIDAGAPATVTTDADGVASLTPALPLMPGTYQVTFAFAGEPALQPATITISLTVSSTSAGSAKGELRLLGGGAAEFQVEARRGRLDGHLRYIEMNPGERPRIAMIEVRALTAFGIAPTGDAAWFAGTDRRGRSIVAYIEDGRVRGRRRGQSDPGLLKLWADGVLLTDEGTMRQGRIEIDSPSGSR